MRKRKFTILVGIIVVSLLGNVGKVTLASLTPGLLDEHEMMSFEEINFPGLDIYFSYRNYEGMCWFSLGLETEENRTVDYTNWDFYIKGTGFDKEAVQDAWHAGFAIGGLILEQGTPIDGFDRYQKSEVEVNYYGGVKLTKKVDIEYLPDEEEYRVSAFFTLDPSYVISTNLFYDDIGDHWFASYQIDGRIPEPATIALLIFGTLIMMHKRKKHRG